MKKLSLIFTAAVVALTLVSCNNDNKSVDDTRLDSQLAGKTFVSSSAKCTSSAKGTKAQLSVQDNYTATKLAFDMFISAINANCSISFSASVNGEVSAQILYNDRLTSIPEDLNGWVGEQGFPEGTFKVFTSDSKIYFGMDKVAAATLYASIKAELGLTLDFEAAIKQFPVLVATENYYAIPFVYKLENASLTLSVDMTYLNNLVKSADNFVYMKYDATAPEGSDDALAISAWETAKGIIDNMVNACASLEISVVFNELTMA